MDPVVTANHDSRVVDRRLSVLSGLRRPAEETNQDVTMWLSSLCAGFGPRKIIQTGRRKPPVDRPLPLRQMLVKHSPPFFANYLSKRS